MLVLIQCKIMPQDQCYIKALPVFLKSGDVPQSQNVHINQLQNQRPSASTGQGRSTDALSSVTYKTITCGWHVNFFFLLVKHYSWFLLHQNSFITIMDIRNIYKIVSKKPKHSYKSHLFSFLQCLVAQTRDLISKVCLI